jgi:hypothetical protein
MSSNADFVSAQRRLLNLHENGHNMTQDEMVRALDGLLGVTQQMVRNRREEIRNLTTLEIPAPGFRALTPPGSPPARSSITTPSSPPRPGTPPTARFRALTPPGSPPAQRRYPPAELRPAAAPRTFPNLFAAGAADYLRAGDYTNARQLIGLANDFDAEERRYADERRYTAPVRRPSQLLREINTTLGRATPVAQQGRNHISWGEYFSQCIKYRSIGKARFESNCTETCAICLDTHTNGDSVVTEKCQHCFGKQCWERWIRNPAGNQTCPTCREERPKVISYTMRRPRSNAMVDDDASVATQEN